MRTRRIWQLVAFVAMLFSLGRAHGQTQMLLPYNYPIFQSTWENPSVRPWFRYSVGVPLLSSLELGAVENGFTLSSVTEKRGDRLVLLHEPLDKALRERESTILGHGELEVELLHYRMMWRDWFFWFGGRNVTRLSADLPSDLLRLFVVGNEEYVGQSISLNDMRLDLMNYHEFTFGFSRMMDNLTFGFRASFLAGQLGMKYAARDAHIDIAGEDDLYRHTVKADAELMTSGIPKKDYNPEEPDEAGLPDLSNLTGASLFSFSNPGFALSGGVSYKPEKNTTLSFSFSDVGMIAWGGQLSTLRLKEQEVEFEGVDGFEKILKEDRLDWSLLGKVSEKVSLDSVAARDGLSFTSWLSPRFHLVAGYKFARASEVGLSVSAIVHQGHFFPSVTASVSQGWSDIFFGQFAVSYNQRSVLNMGLSLVFNPGPVQIYLITDNLLGLIKPTIMHAANVRLGINVVFGPRYPNNLLTHR